MNIIVPLYVGFEIKQSNKPQITGLSLLHIIQSSPRAHPALYPVGTGGFLRE
jgi:UDP-N-acetylglucosamine pyrophosphorylase